MLARSIVVVTFLFIGVAPTEAQVTPRVDSLPVGVRVRGVSSADASAIEGFFRSADADSLRIGPCKRCDAGPAIPLSSLRFLQVEQRRRHISVGETAGYLLVGTFLGAAAGALTGAGYAYREVHQPNCGDLCGLSWLAVPYLGIGGAAAGFVTGGVLAATHHESYWLGVRLRAP